MAKCRTLLSNGNYLFPSILPSISPSAFSIHVPPVSRPLLTLTLSIPFSSPFIFLTLPSLPSPSSLPFLFVTHPSLPWPPSLPSSFLTLPPLPWPSALPLILLHSPSPSLALFAPCILLTLPLWFTLLPPSLSYSLLHSSYLSFCPSLLDPLLAFALVLNVQCRK